MRWLLAVVVLCGACKQGDKSFDGPMPVKFGACAGPTTTWVSGPRPLPFKPEEANGPWLAAGRKPPPPAKPETPPVGSADSAMVGSDNEAARKEAIKEAREAGLLGSTALVMHDRHSDTAPIATDPSGFGPAPDNAGGGGLGFGRIGHGSGTGAGYGGRGWGRGTGPVPTVAVGVPMTGDLDKAIVKRYIHRNLQKIEYCYEKQLLAKPSLAGTVQAQFFIAANGTVSKSTASGVDPDVSSCIADVIKEIEFPKPHGGAGVQVNYPFVLRAAGGDTTPPKATGSADGPAPAPPPPEAKQPQPIAARERELFRAVDADFVDPKAYSPQQANPLVAQAGQLTACFRKNKTHYGAVVVDLAGPNVYGLDSDSATACVVAIAKTVKANAGATRCSVAFGEMPITDLPTIDVTATAVSFDGKPVGDSQDKYVIADLESAIAAKVQDALAAKAVSMSGPVIVRPDDTAPMKTVVRAMGSVLAAGDDFILERKVGTAWQPMVQGPAFPIVPVPIGTGGMWNPVRGQSRLGGSGVDDERVTMSILVEKDKTWIGISRINEFYEVPNLGGVMDDQKLETLLKEQKASAFFTDRTDVEVAGDDDVTYAEVLRAIKTLAQAGFTDWQLTDPLGLAAKPSL